jgi:xanthine/uracil permease
MTIPPRNPSRHAAARADFFRMVRWIIAVGVVMVAGLLFVLARDGLARPAAVIGTIAGVFFSILLGCGLFAAAFFSDKSGHDEDASRAGRDDLDKRP